MIVHNKLEFHSLAGFPNLMLVGKARSLLYSWIP